MKELKEIGFSFNSVKDKTNIHSFHPYPAKFPPQLPRNILATFAKSGEKVLDPFCGSGTTLVEAKLQNIDAVGVDVNGLACLLSKVKSTPLSSKEIEVIEAFLKEVSIEKAHWQFDSEKENSVPKIEGLAHWFQPNVAHELAWLREKIWSVSDEKARDFLKVAFSSIIVRVSNQESDTRFAAIEKSISDGFTFKTFLEKAESFLEHIQNFSSKATNESKVEVHNTDSRSLDFIKTESFDLVLTSPPYANTYDYYLYHKFRKRWLEIDVKFAQYNEIGSRREFSSLKKKPKKWIEDLEKTLAEMSRVLKAGKHIFLVIGDSVINKELLKIDEVISAIAPKFSLSVVEILSSDLAKHSKLFNPAFMQKGKKEHLIHLRKFND
jgi:site-specific DNA-methyltransferase (cytosine-N4-specific)